MASQSQYWLNKRNIYAQSKEKNEKLKDKYDAFLPKLQSLSSSITSVSSSLNSSKSSFTNGGYVNAGKGLYSDKIDAIISELSSNEEILTKSINFCTERIKVLVGTIASYEVKRREAHNNYIYWRDKEKNVTIKAV